MGKENVEGRMGRDRKGEWIGVWEGRMGKGVVRKNGKGV